MSMKKFKYQNYKIIAAALLIFLISGFLIISNDKEISEDLSWAERMALSIMKRNPESWQVDFRETPKWSYTHGLVLHGFTQLYLKTGDEDYFNYVKDYADKLIDENGNISTYEIEVFNIDHINPGKVLFDVYEKTGDEKYLKALNKLRKQLEWQPRTKEGGFWHKLRYPWQMWLDGLYMGAPFYAEYIQKFENANDYNDVIDQFVIIENHVKDNTSGLLYHGWDESGVQRWALPETGVSRNFWGRSVGWYAMALVDVLDYIPEDHPRRSILINKLRNLVDAIIVYQDKDTGLWFQVLDQAGREGNYLEASASVMFTYTIAKAANNGYIDKDKKEVAKKSFQGVIDHFVKIGKKGEIHIEKVCAVAGLGGNPYRDGTFDYYISEQVISNDPKATGPFILACLELEK